MPIFNLQLQFDESGAISAVRKLDDVANTADNVGRSVNGLGQCASGNTQALARMGEQGSRASDTIVSSMKKATNQLLSLVGAYKAVSKAMDFMSRGLEFNSALEQSQIGIASLVTSMVKLQDAQGNMLEGQEKFNAAQEISADLMQKIQTLGLQTTADSKSIVEGFQAILAPALSELNNLIIDTKTDKIGNDFENMAIPLVEIEDIAAYVEEHKKNVETVASMADKDRENEAKVQKRIADAVKGALNPVLKERADLRGKLAMKKSCNYPHCGQKKIDLDSTDFMSHFEDGFPFQL